jgi:hypothetical protein
MTTPQRASCTDTLCLRSCPTDGAGSLQIAGLAVSAARMSVVICQGLGQRVFYQHCNLISLRQMKHWRRHQGKLRQKDAKIDNRAGGPGRGALIRFKSQQTYATCFNQTDHYSISITRREKTMKATAILGSITASV